MLGDETTNSVRAALARGDLLAAYDEVARGKELGHRGLDYLEVLTLARLGDTERGLRLYETYRLASMGDVDALSLKARLLKDEAFASGLAPNREKLLQACALYAAVYRRTRSSYPAINAATLARIGGRSRLANALAGVVVEQHSSEGRQDYFSLATLAEALVVLGDIDGAAAALSRAVRAPDADVGSRSTTFLQLQRLVSASYDAEELKGLLEPVRPPKVAMFCGNIFVGYPELEARLAADMRQVIVDEKVGFAYGALAAGSDILIAEQLIDAGVELHIVLPFAEADFLTQSVAPSGEEWVRRYAGCKARAASLTLASNMSFVGEQAQFAYGSKVTMGMAMLRARHLNGDSIQLAVVEAEGTGTLSGSDIAAWGAAGGRSAVLRADRLQRPVKPPPPPESVVKRGTYGLMFSDFPGFTGLDERALPIFWEEVMGRAATALERYEDVIRERNTWGDALYVVFEDARSTAAAALDLSEEFGKVDCKALGVPEGTAMRIALHYGTTYFGHDPVSRRTTYYGSEVSRAARIEPVTPSGSVYVTEPFAAVLEMEADHPFTCNYVGKTELAKGYGVYPLYRLRRDPMMTSDDL
ncbi:adenylate/guanylate cyclase domain-containing protein [Phenylobacterium sp.]|uniref:adenylate/guanylate cyclase domain-containing protein n=1 Tax=Phenylobacterium sp. TaxID=1871053 RepID=UPI0025E2E823|nr:adenylate/guanylate cyclase domain-containing protein [Phenylobacterium sp.]